MGDDYSKTLTRELLDPLHHIIIVVDVITEWAAIVVPVITAIM